ncbi:hypothetical protein [Vibrio sp. vnigr-6D03]|uniref:hypothetical protein n=1 Tax=Vibrio sp. vnigr-6D03 TaxID=2058088 RepID=UPI0011AF8A6C|nr:hypothetical protein [Vibrio sp. vnigr-6D03]
MFNLFYLVSWLSAVTGLWLVGLNARPYFLQIAPFVFALILVSLVAKYRKKRLLIVLFGAAMLGLIVGFLQVNGYISIGHTGVMEIPTDRT